MRRLLACGLALALAVLAVTTFARTPEAQTGAQVLEACGPGKQDIDARALPAAVVEPGRCPVAGRTIRDGKVGSVVPPPGESVHAEVLTISGAQELGVTRLSDGTIRLDLVGDDSGPPDGGFAAAGSRASAAGDGCGDPAHAGLDYRVEGTLSYRVNLRTTPSGLSRRAAVAAIRRAGANIAGTKNPCSMGDRNPSRIDYAGHTTRYPDRVDRSCTQSDGVSVVAFGDLPSSSTLAVTCTYYSVRTGYDRVGTSDVKINKGDFRWTTSPGARSCKGRYDLEAVMTHERGHTFGLGHVLEQDHPNLTMSGGVNGPCQGSERSLGRGDVLGLDEKYAG